MDGHTELPSTAIAGNSANLYQLFRLDMRTRTRIDVVLRIAIFLTWLLVVSFLISRHVMWRDEVRAYSLATNGDSYWQMLLGLRGEGHPALWYMLLRFSHDIFQTQQVLPAVAAVVGTAAMLLFTFRSPFRPIVVFLVLFSLFGLYEFVVMARNYGLSMLILFAMTALYGRFRQRSIVLAILIFLLCNSNAHSVVVAAGFLIFWFFDLSSSRSFWAGIREPAFLAGCAAFILGAATCYWEIGFPLQDAILTPQQIARKGEILPLVTGLLLPSIPLNPLFPAASIPVMLFYSIVLWLVLGGLLHRPGLFLAGLSVQTGIILLFNLVYPGGYRHVSLYLVFILCLYWLASEKFGGDWPQSATAKNFGTRWFKTSGCMAVIFLLALQVTPALARAIRSYSGEPESSSAGLASLIRHHRLQNAIVMGDPDYHLEALPFYADNPTFFVRENRFGKSTLFSTKAELNLKLGNLLASAKRLRSEYSRPIVILMENKIDPSQPDMTTHKGYVWTLKMSSGEAQNFLAATCKLGGLHEATSDENYDVYLLPLSGGTLCSAGGRSGR